MKKTSYGTGATSFSDGSSRLVSTLKSGKNSRVRKKRKKRKLKYV